jgi:ABC-type nitrate/sulfonate/bicarbonate transport system substrate-binding protein
MAAGSVVAGDFAVVSSIIGLTRGLPLIAPFLGSLSTPSHPLERIMVMENSPIRDLDDLKGKKLAFLGPGTVPECFSAPFPKGRRSVKRT